MPKNNITKEENIGTPCGIIPYDLNLKGKWLHRIGGDGAFYKQLRVYANKIEYIKEVQDTIEINNIIEYTNIKSDISNNIISVDKSNEKLISLKRNKKI